MKIFSKNEYGNLKSIIVGRSEYAGWPAGDNFFDCMLNISTYHSRPDKGRLPQIVIDEAKEDSDNFVKLLESQNVKVYRPELYNFEQKIHTPYHTTTGMSSWSTRDLLLIIGDMAIECPTAFVSRQHENIVFDHIKQDAIKDGCRWISAPTPRIRKEDYNIVNNKIVLTEDYPIFDAANVLRLDDKLLYLKSSTANLAGANWLQKIVGTEYEVVVWEDVYAHAHIDSTLLSIDKNTILINATRVKESQLPSFCKSYKKIWVNTCSAENFYKFPYASKWIGLNVLSISPETIIVDSIQKQLTKQLQDNKFKVLNVANRHSRTLGGGFHCMTCDLEREHE